MAGARIQSTILAPDTHVAAHPMAVLVPFAAGHALRAPLAELAEAAAESDAHQVVTDDAATIAHDALLIAVGALQRPPSSRVLAFGAPGSEERMHGLIQDLEAGYARRIAFVAPAAASWPLPLYELALMTAERAYACASATS